MVLDFGSQFAQLIARRVRELHVYSELLPHDTPLAEIERRGASAIILSGGPNSVYDDGAPKPDPAIWSGRLPVLGICYGAQLMASELGGHVQPTGKREYGPATVTIGTEDGLFVGPRSDAAGLDEPRRLDHGAARGLLARRPRPTRRRSPGLVDHQRHLYGIQFHPEVAHTPRGRDVLRNFVVGVAGANAHLDARRASSSRPSRRSAAAWTSTPDERRLRRQGHLRAVGRRRLGRRGRARPPRRRAIA